MNVLLCAGSALAALRSEPPNGQVAFALAANFVAVKDFTLKPRSWTAVAPVAGEVRTAPAAGIVGFDAVHHGTSDRE